MAARIPPLKSAYFCLVILFVPFSNLTRAEPPQFNPYEEKANALNAMLNADIDDEGLNDGRRDDGELANKRFNIGMLNAHARQMRQIQPPNLDIEKIIGKRKRLGGIDDPYFPTYIKVKPSRIRADEADREVLRSLMDREGYIPLNEGTADLLRNLSREELKGVLGKLAKVPVKVKWKDKEGQCHSGPKRLLNTVRFSHWDKTNAAGALALIVGARQDIRLLTDIIALAPDAVMFELAGDAASVIPLEAAANALIDIMSQLEGTNTNRIASSAANVVQVFIEYWAEGNADQQIYALTTLIYESHQAMLNSHVVFSKKHIGVLLGALLAGSMLYAKKLKTADEQNLWAINSASNLIWASTTFLGVIPLAGSAVAALAGTISVAAVTWAVVYNKIGTRDFTPRIVEIEGHIELSALEAAEARSAKSRLEMLEVLEWMEGAVHVNGLHD